LVEILVEPVYKKKLPENFQYIAKKNIEKSGMLHEWSKGCEECFEKLKRLTIALVMTFPS
jgi:hypothetical protein